MNKRWTRIQTNSLIVNLELVLLQVYILWELNGQLGAMLARKDPVELGVAFAPALALTWIARRYATIPGKDNGNGHS